MFDISTELKTLQLSDQIFKSIKFFVSGIVHDKVVELLKCGGAERMNYFSDYVTHLICGYDVEETDLSDANDLYEIPAVTPKWVFICARLKRLVSTKPYTFNNNKLFSNFVFCFSKIPAVDRNALWSIVTYHGGIVQFNLTDSCTHLVSTGTTSSKYIKAFSLGAARVAIVTPDWVVESARSKSLVQTDLFHPKLILQPKIIKHESTTAITGFEPEPSELDDNRDSTGPDSTQALLAKLKQRMPWNQPVTTASAKDVAPPNVVAPSYTAPRLPITQAVQQNLQQAQQQRIFTQLVQSQPQQPQPQQVQQQQPFQAQSNLANANQIARGVVHHTAAQGNLIGQPQPQLSQFNQPTQIQLAQNRLQQQQQQQQQQRVNLLSQITQQQQVNKVNTLGPFNQQIVQRNQLGQMVTSSMGGQVTTGHLAQIAQPAPQLGQMVGVGQVGQSIIQRGQMGQLGKTPVSIQQLQQQLANRQQALNQQQQFVNASINQTGPQPQSFAGIGQQPPHLTIQQQQLGQQQQQQTKLLQNQFVQQQGQNQQPEGPPQAQSFVQQFGGAQQFVQQTQPQPFNNQPGQQIVQGQFVPQNRPPSAFGIGQPQLVNQQLVGQQQIVNLGQQQQQLVNQQPQQLVGQPPPQIGNQQLVNQQQQMTNQQQHIISVSQPLNQPQIGGNQLVNAAQQLINQQHQQPGVQLVNHQVINQQQQINKPLLLNQPGQQVQTVQPPNQPKPLWPQQQQQQQPPLQLGIRHPVGFIQQQQQPPQPPQQQQQPQQQPQGPRVQWSPTQQQQQAGRQYIHLDAHTHQQLQQMAPEQRAIFIAKLQKQRQVLLQRQLQIQQQQRTAGHVLIRSGPVPQGLNPQQQMQWLQQQAKQQGVMLQQSTNIQQQQPPPSPQPVAVGAPLNQSLQHAPGLSPIQQQPTTQFPDQNQQLQQLQRQQQFRLQQLQLQREQAQKAAATPQPQPQPQPQQPQPQQPLPNNNIVNRPIGQPQTAEAAPPTTVVDASVAQQQLVVNAKTKTALANMLSIRLQSGGSTLGPTPDTITEPSAAGTLRLMTAQHNAALNSNNRPQDLLGLPQRRAITGPNGELIRPAPAPSAPPPAQPDPPKLQYSPRNNVLPLQHRQGPFYGHNPNLKLPPDLFLLGCIFVVVELDHFLEKSIPEWQQQLEKHGGEVEKQYCSRVTHVLCETQRHGVVMQALRDCKRCVTLYWLSDVMKRKQVLPPWTALHLPTMYLDTTPASKHLISLTGFVNSERNRIKHMIKYIGATFTNYLSKHNTLLIASKAEGPKFVHAKKWGTPVVNIQWLTDVMLGNFSALNQTEHIKYQQFAHPPVFNFEPSLVPSLMHAWKMPINISQESYERVKRSPSPVVLPKKAKKIKTEHTNDENENPYDQAPPSATHRILFSMLASTEELKKMVKDLGGSLARGHADCTHLVMPYLARSNKLLHCICLGVQVMPEQWLRDSHASAKFLDHSNYSLDTKEFNSEYKCDFNQTLATRNRNKLFEGKFFYITPSVFPSKSVLMELIRSCSGIVEKNRRTVSQIEATNINSPYSYIILTHANDLHLVYDVLRNKKDKVRTVCNVELIFSAILKQTFEVEPYAVQVCEVQQ